MAAGARQRAVRSDKIALAAKVAPPERELDQFAHLDGMDWFRDGCHAGSFSPRRVCGNRIVFGAGRRRWPRSVAFGGAGIGAALGFAKAVEEEGVVGVGLDPNGKNIWIVFAMLLE